MTPADRHVDGVVEMMLDATRKYRDPLTEERLFGWHAGLFPTRRSPIAKMRAGAWRDDRSGPMRFVSGLIGRERVHYQAPGAERLSEEMSPFLEWFNRLLDGFEGKLTSSKWAKLTRCSQDSAHRDIVDLVERGILAKDAAGGRSTSYSLRAV